MDTETPIVLIVDDDMAIREVLDTFLDGEGYRTIVAANGHFGVLFAQAHQPDVILMDIMMPVMDGVAAIHELKQHDATRNIPIIAMSAGTNLVARSDEIEADGILAKPFDLDAVLAILMFHIRRHDAR